MRNDGNPARNTFESTSEETIEDLLKYKLMWETARDMIFFYNSDGQIVDINEQVLQTYGYSREELLRMNIVDLRSPTEKLKIMKQTQDCYMSPCLFETVQQRKDGSTFQVEISTNSLKNGQPTLAAIVRDITDRKKIEKALVKSKAILARAQDIAHIGNWAWDLKEGKMQWSAEIFKIFRIPATPLPISYQEFIARLYPDDLPCFQELVEQALGKDQLFNVDLRIIILGGSLCHINFVADRIKRGLSGAPEWMYGIIQDITPRKEIENKLREAQARAELYMDLMGHDINNMNMAALGFLEMAHNKLDSEGRLDRTDAIYLDKPIENIENSSTLIYNVRQLQRIKTGKLTLSPMDVGQIISSVIEQYAITPGRDIRITFEPCACQVMANELLRDVISNLVGNAIKHSSGMLTVHILQQRIEEGTRRYCQVIVEDTGPGIPDMLKTQIFDRSGDIDKWHGRGLGLYLVRTLIDHLGGRVRVEDRVPGNYRQGARFIVQLPAID